MKPTPINMAEAIFEPFWDPQLSGLAQWTVEPGEAHGLKVRQNWCWVTFEWARKPAAGPALRMWRKFDLDCSGYDHLLISVMAPEGSILRVTALPLLGGAVQTRIAMLKKGRAGRLTIAVTLELRQA